MMTPQIITINVITTLLISIHLFSFHASAFITNSPQPYTCCNNHISINSYNNKSSNHHNDHRRIIQFHPKKRFIQDPLSFSSKPHPFHDTPSSFHFHHSSSTKLHYQSFLITETATGTGGGVPIFDGSSITDPIVVSSLFWKVLKGKIISLLIGQLLTMIVFTLVVVLLPSQFEKLGTFLSNQSSTIFKQDEERQQQWIQNWKPDDLSQRNISPNYSKLMICILIDTIGSSSELIPIIGEITDVVWAPIAAYLVRKQFNNSNVVFVLEFAEEFLPLTDLLPLATFCWLIETYYRESDIAKVLRIGSYGSPSTTTTTVKNTSREEGND